jgi:hypothetical protein
MRPRTPEGTSTAAHFSPFFGSSGVIWRGGLSNPGVWIRSRIPSEIYPRKYTLSLHDALPISDPIGSCPNRATISERMRLVAG